MKKLLVITLFALSTCKAMDDEIVSYVPEGLDSVHFFLPNNSQDARVPICFGPRVPTVRPPLFIEKEQLHAVAMKIISFGIETKQLRTLSGPVDGFVVLKLTDALSNRQGRYGTLLFLNDLSFWFNIVTILPELAWYQYREEDFPSDPQDHLVPEGKN